MKFVKTINSKQVIVEEKNPNHHSIWINHGFTEHKVELTKK